MDTEEIRNLHDENMHLVFSIAATAAGIVASGWCQGRSAEDIDGNEVAFDSKKAVKWCLTAAICRACETLNADERYKGAYESSYEEACNWIANKYAGGDADLIAFNDAEGRQHDEVCQLLADRIREFAEPESGIKIVVEEDSDETT